MLLGLAAADTKAECTSTPDCTSLGYTKTESDCPLESVKCPTNPSMVYCDSVLKPVGPTIEDCTGVTEVIVPPNASCTEMKISCPSKCTGWSCNDGYVKSGIACMKQGSSCEDYGYYTSRKTPITQWTCSTIIVQGMSCYNCSQTSTNGKKNCIGGAPGSTCACGGTHSGYAAGHVCVEGYL